MMTGEAFYKKMLDNMYDGVYFVDVNRQITFWNKGAERITGFKVEEVMGSHCYDNILNHVDLEGKRICFGGCPLHATLDDHQPRSTQVFLHHKEGHRVPVYVRTMPIIEEGEVVGAVEIFRDDSERLEVINHIETLKSMAMTDELTGIANRRYVKEFVQSKLSELNRLGISFGLAFIDIDNFKNVNDTYGHDVGDEVIQLITNTALNTLRKTDLIGRWGGEEFVAVFVGVDQKELEIVAEKLRFLVENSSLRIDGEADVRVTISLGATLATEVDDVDSLIERSDQLMYLSKTEGKNRVSYDVD